MLWNWRTWALLALLVIPSGAYVALGTLWLWEHGPIWVLGGSLTLITSFGLFAALANQWTRSKQPLLPPIDWEAPETFTPQDRAAWELVQEYADRGDKEEIQRFTNGDLYIETGRAMATQLAQHYRPKATEPIDDVPVIELLTALELAVEDLGRLCREVPGGDVVTPGHWKQAIQAAQFVSKANEVYSILLPFLSPVSGFARLGVQKMVSQPAWRSMQKTLMRWFYRAFVNRLGHHLVELYSGRLSIGAENYRRLTRESSRTRDEGPAPTVLVTGLPPNDPKRLVKTIKSEIAGEGLELTKLKLISDGREPALAERLPRLQFQATPYPKVGRASSGTDKARKSLISDATDTDLFVLFTSADSDAVKEAIAIMTEWSNWYHQHPELSRPPALVVVDGHESGEETNDHQSSGSVGLEGGTATSTERRTKRATAADRIRAAVPKEVGRVLEVNLAADRSIQESVPVILAALARRSREADRAALLRYLHQHSSRSQARRVLDTIGRHGYRLFQRVRNQDRSDSDD